MNAASKLPGLKQGTSAIDDLAEKAREILHKAFERVSAALKSAASANAEASPSPSPSPGLDPIAFAHPHGILADQ